jgi:hypothetical protein
MSISKATLGTDYRNYDSKNYHVCNSGSDDNSNNGSGSYSNRDFENRSSGFTTSFTNGLLCTRIILHYRKPQNNMSWAILKEEVKLFLCLIK